MQLAPGWSSRERESLGVGKNSLNGGPNFHSSLGPQSPDLASMTSEAPAITMCHRVKVGSLYCFHSFVSRRSESLSSQPAFLCVVRWSELSLKRGKIEGCEHQAGW